MINLKSYEYWLDKNVWSTDLNQLIESRHPYDKISLPYNYNDLLASKWKTLI